ncbi:hypothetical protein [Phenylobacterium aquaticum]|uniref:hypothetical protein n=1 Tax=Phenylobacterium aquaticum TaxID=1763816 RepID=UPI001F5CD8CB|nr:hypothetical protein [Phenylobacterium aquaticum]MCI3133702.1 hypothetical protein [Phenylobacterium aquaticum]
MTLMRNLLNGLIALALILAADIVAPAPALAAPDARVDAVIRPCFGLLTNPDIRCKGTTHRRKPGYGYGNTRSYYPSTYIDCAYAWPGQISDTIERSWNGATITLTSSNGRACEEAVVVNRPVRIVGDARAPLSFARPLLIAPPGQPCLRLAPAIWVTLQDLTIGQAEGAEAPCILGQTDELNLYNTSLAYSGAGGAIALAGDSKLTLADSRIVSRSQAPAVTTRGRLKINHVTIGAAVIGLKATPTDDVKIDDLELVRLDDWTGSQRSAASAGLVLTEVGASQLIEVSGLDINGFSRGAYVSGAGEVNLRSPSITGADWALLVEGPTTRVSKALLSADEVGVYAAAGTTYVSQARIQGVMRSGIFAERGAQVRSVDNTVFAAKDGCAALKSGFFEGALTCRPWFEAPELGGGHTRTTLPTFDSFQAVLDSEQEALATPSFKGGPPSAPAAYAPAGRPSVAAPLPGAGPYSNGGAAPNSRGASQGGSPK